MLRSPFVVALVRRAAHRRLRRLGGTQTLAWAVRIPLVTLVVMAALAMLLPLRRGAGRTR
ncbi:MAG: hypothetical protein JHC74_08700 [Thermoleophilia bacterium]|nr:hypothetical protein [Thermoleophilia bacterium]